MSVAQAEKPATQLAAQRVPEIRIYGHSTILYWWPVWVAGFVMAAITFAEGAQAVIVPAGSTEAGHTIAPPADAARPVKPASAIGERFAESKNLGVVFTVILLLVVFVTNTPLRGLWSAIAILLVLVMTLTFAWLGLWSDVLELGGRISIHMNMGFYMFFSSLLF